MKRTLILTLFFLFMLFSTEARKTSRSRSSGSGRGSGRKTNYNPQPSPTSLSYPQPSAPKPTLFGWQEKPAQRGQSASSWQTKPNSQSHSYPSGSTGLSGNSQQKQPPSYQESIQRNQASNNLAGQQTPTRTASQPNNQPSHSYPSSNGLSGNSGSGYPPQQGSGLSGSGYPSQQGSGLSGSGYPSQGSGLSGSGYPSQQGGGLSGSGSGLSGSGVGYPHQGSGVANPGGPPPAYSGYKPANNYGNTYNHPQGPPPPYSNYGGHSGYGGHGVYNPGFGASPPGYFGNYANYGKGIGGVSRTRSALTGVGIAGAGVGTLLTGLALWNLARSTGQHRHTVIYDNRGQPVAVAPNNGTAPAVDPMLADLVNCSLTVSNENTTEILAIPCAIASSFYPEADVKDLGAGNKTDDKTKCTVTVFTKTGKEYMTTIPCSTLLNTAAENNVTEPSAFINGTENVNNSTINNENLNQPSALMLSGEPTDLNNMTKNCVPQSESTPDPINPCYSVTHNLTVIPLESNNSSISLSTPSTPTAA